MGLLTEVSRVREVSTIGTRRLGCRQCKIKSNTRIGLGEHFRIAMDDWLVAWRKIQLSLFLYQSQKYDSYIACGVTVVSDSAAAKQGKHHSLTAPL